MGNNSTKAWWSGDEKYGQKIDEKTIDELNRLYHPVKTSIEEQSKYKALARFAIRDMGATVAAGMCLKIEEHWD